MVFLKIKCNFIFNKIDRFLFAFGFDVKVYCRSWDVQ